MKRILLYLFLAIAGIARAQIVNIPDPEFKTRLLQIGSLAASAKGFDGNYINIDANNDNEIQVSEALAVMELTVNTPGPEGSWPKISSLEGISSFSNLQFFSFFSNNVTELDLTALTNLKTVFAYNNQISSLTVSGMTSLEEIACGGNQLSVLNLSGLVNLTKLTCGNNNLSQLDLSDSPNIKSLGLSDNPLVSLNFSSLQLLEIFACEECALEAIDLSESSGLRQIRVAGSQSLTYINLKNNGITGQPQYCTFSNCPNLLFVCLDEGEDVVLENYLPAFTNANTYCTSYPGGDYNRIEGSVGYNYNGNGCDSGDTVNSYIKVNLNDGPVIRSFISRYGFYNFYVTNGTYSVSPEFENDLFTVTPPLADVSFNEVNNTLVTENFCIAATGIHPDLDIVIVPSGARPGFNSKYRITYRNKGNQPLSGSVVFNYQEDVLDFISSSPVTSSSTEGELVWNFTNLEPLQQKRIFVTLNANGPTETPPLNIGDELGFTATINPVSGDDTPDDNVFELKQVVIGSMDPNDITCLEGNSVNPDKIGEYLHYNINFENTGTAPATFIVVKDVIDTTQFDINTLQLLDASHPVQATITGDKVEFRFDAINLGSHEKGNVVFKIKTLNTLQVNDDVAQHADIFFDYNWPIATNDATTVFEVLSRGDFAMDNSVKAYPNPAKGVVNINASTLIKSIELYDVQGRLLQAGSNASMDISSRAMGIYFVKVFTENGMKVEKIVKE